MPKKPTNFRDLLNYLESHPHVSFVRPDKAPEPSSYVKYEKGLLWFRGQDGTESHLPVACGLQPAALHETGIAFHPDRFTFTKFGVALEFFYAEAPPEDEKRKSIADIRKAMDETAAELDQDG